MYKVVVSDLDGTLLNTQHQISPHTRHTLHRLHAQGIQLVVATGRHHVDVQGIRDALGLELFLITANGAVIHDPQDRLIYNQVIPPEIAQELVEIERPEEVALNVYRGNAWFVEEEQPEYLAFHRDSGFAYQLVDLASLDKRQINKVFYTGEHEVLQALEARLLERYADTLSITFSLPSCLEVMSKGVNKGNAVQAVLEQHGWRLEEAVAFGDGMNDFEMLSMVGLGVVMDNAHDRLKSALPAHPRTLTADEEGVAHYLDRLFA